MKHLSPHLRNPFVLIVGLGLLILVLGLLVIPHAAATRASPIASKLGEAWRALSMALAMTCSETGWRFVVWPWTSEASAS